MLGPRHICNRVTRRQIVLCRRYPFGHGAYLSFPVRRRVNSSGVNVRGRCFTGATENVWILKTNSVCAYQLDLQEPAVELWSNDLNGGSQLDRSSSRVHRRWSRSGWRRKIAKNCCVHFGWWWWWSHIVIEVDGDREDKLFLQDDIIFEDRLILLGYYLHGSLSNYCSKLWLPSSRYVAVLWNCVN